MLACNKAKYDKKKRIICNVTGTPCGHVFMCQLSMKWKQTEQAAKCPLRRDKDANIRSDL